MSDRLLSSARNLVFEIDLGEIKKLLALAGIPMLVLKGPHVASTLYHDPAERNYCDLDVLVNPEHYYPAAKVLLANDFRLFPVNRRRLASEMADYQLLLLSPRGVAIELHRALADPDQFRSDVKGFFLRAEEFTFGALQARGLATEDLLLHLCLHFGKRHFMTSEPKHLKDIALLLARRSVDWPVYLQRLSEAGCRTVSHYCLNAVRLQHGSEIPREVMAALTPGRGRRHLLDKYLEPAVFPIYRFPNNVPGFRERMVNLLLIDRVAKMVRSSAHFAWLNVKNALLRVPPLRFFWSRRQPLAKWMQFR